MHRLKLCDRTTARLPGQRWRVCQRSYGDTSQPLAPCSHDLWPVPAAPCARRRELIEAARYGRNSTVVLRAVRHAVRATLQKGFGSSTEEEQRRREANAEKEKARETAR
jgi:hypothetical protein